EDAAAFGVLGYGSEASERPKSESRPADLASTAPAAARMRESRPESAPALAAAVEPSLFAAAQAAPPVPGDSLEAIAAQASACRKCPLGGLRTHAVPGQGSARAELMFVGEAPGADEDEQGLAFVGAAGKLLTKMIAAMGLSRDDVFIGNVLKC